MLSMTFPKWNAFHSMLQPFRAPIKSLKCSQSRLKAESADRIGQGERLQSPQGGHSHFSDERPLLGKVVIQNQNFEFPVENGGLTRDSRHSPKSSEGLVRAQSGQSLYNLVSILQARQIERSLLDWW